MSRCRFVKPSVVRLPLSEGEWIEVKKELAIGELNKWRTASIVGYRQKNKDAEPEFRLDMRAAGVARAAAYLVDWSFRDWNDKPMKYSVDALQSLSEADFNEIDAAIDAHVTALEQEKKASRGETTSSPDSPSAVISAGPGTSTNEPQPM
jgi:hypothetical protein